MKIHLIDPILLLVIFGAMIAVGGLIVLLYGIFVWMNTDNKISGRLEHYVAGEGKSSSRNLLQRIIPREIKGSLFDRTIAQWVRNLIHFIGRFTPSKSIADLDRNLEIAGNPMKMRATDFYAFRFIFCLAGVIIAIWINRDIQHLKMVSILIGVLIILFCLMLPTVWLNGLVRNKKDIIRRDLPDALDMLSVCASAGLGFDQSLQKISSYWHTNLGNEIKRVIHEMEMGVARSTALKNMSARLDVDDLSRFISIIVQAETMGMSYADVLHSQAAQMRILRQFRAREIANKLPAKMIVPLAVLIFPALIAVIIGPMLPTLLNLF